MFCLGQVTFPSVFAGRKVHSLPGFSRSTGTGCTVQVSSGNNHSKTSFEKKLFFCVGECVKYVKILKLIGSHIGLSQPKPPHHPMPSGNNQSRMPSEAKPSTGRSKVDPRRENEKLVQLLSTFLSLQTFRSP